MNAEIADLYLIKQLRKIVEVILIRCLDVSNCIHLFSVALKYKTGSLKRLSLEMVVKNIKQLFETPCYKEL